MLYQNVTKIEMSKILGFSINTINSGLDAFIQARAKNGIKITEVGKRGNSKLFNIEIDENYDNSDTYRSKTCRKFAGIGAGDE